MKRRDFLRGAAALPLLRSPIAAAAMPVAQDNLVNDVHTGLNPTRVERILRPASVAELRDLVRDCARHNKIISISGSRHAAGGQQFAEGSTLLDMRALVQVHDLNPTSGVLTVDSGIEWPELIRGYMNLQGNDPLWGVRQKQGGADRMTLGGALAANAHGHGLGIPPIVADVEWIDLLTADGALQRCDRRKNKELFALAVGGYGLFGIITTVGLRLAPRRKLRRRVEKRTLAEALALIQRRTKAGAPYGYFQYDIAETSAEFLRAGILTTWEPAPENAAITAQSADLDEESLSRLLELAHYDRESAYRKYASFELDKDGFIEWSDLHQLSNYPAGYHKKIESRRDSIAPGADLILETYVPRNQLISFIEDARFLLQKSEIPLVYGTVRFIEKDTDTFLAWARKPYACVIFTPHVAYAEADMEKGRALCRQLEHFAVKRGGSFYLTYNRFATRSELSDAYPQFSDFLILKRRYDPNELFQSEWYRYNKKLYS